MTAEKVVREIRKLGSKEKARQLARFFKTGPGEYGEGDRFLGVVVPAQRKLAKRYYDELSLESLELLLHSVWHEVRLTSLFMLIHQYEKGDDLLHGQIYELYLRNTKWINNWDLVDGSCYKLLGVHLLERNRKPLYELAESDSLWERRMAIVSTLQFIRHDQFEDTLALCETLLEDDEDLMHKAMGWMLREVGKRDQATLETFLRKHQSVMPRTMLRYAIEKFSPTKRNRYLQGRA